MPPSKVRNADRRSREYLTPAEVDRLAKAAGSLGRHGFRDRCLVLFAATHGLRVSELVGLRWDQLELDAHPPVFHCRRKKRGVASTHPLSGRECRDLRRLRRDYPEGAHLFASERGGPLSDSAVRKLVARAGEAAGLGMPVHPHMLRHAAGYRLANQGRDTRAIQLYLGHRQIQHTVRYTELSADRFKGWEDD